MSGLATALIESTPYLSPGAAGPWCQHLASSVIFLVTASFTRSGSQARKLRLGPGPSLPGLVPSVGKPQLLGACATPSAFPCSYPNLGVRLVGIYNLADHLCLASVSSMVSQGAK